MVDQDDGAELLRQESEDRLKMWEGNASLLALKPYLIAFQCSCASGTFMGTV
jgi:hypothetical protein